MVVAQLRVPADPLERFCALYTALIHGRPWWQSLDTLRFCALGLTTLPGEPRELAARIDATVDELRESRAWYKRSSVGTLLAALLLRHGESAAEFFAEVDRAEPLFREHWRFGGNTYEALAVAVLRAQAHDRRVSAAQVARLAEIWYELKRAHPWLTQKSDWPMCALLSTCEKSPLQIASRLEALYEGLCAHGFRKGDALQTAAQILFFHTATPEFVCPRYQSLYAGFKQSGLWMGSYDYDELALLCFAPQDAALVLTTVAAHREKIAALPHRPDKQTSFSLACGTALLQLAGQSTSVPLLTEAQVLLAIHDILMAQAAATAAAC